ncbi:MAG: SusE domain-containing protein [Bacteroidales bacterium]
MKNILVITLFILGIFAFTACENEEAKVFINENPTIGALISPLSPDGMAFVKADANKKMGFSWSPADFGFQASVTYGVQLSTTDDFANAVTILKTQKLADSVKISDINGALLALELDIDVETTVKCRVYATVSTNVDTTYSEATDYAVTPYDELVDYPMAYVPGDYQGWSPGAVNGRMFSYGFNSDYTNIIRINGNGFKVTINPNWGGPNYGGTLTASGNNFSGVLDPSGGDLFAASGCFVFNFNTSTLALSLTKTDDWGIIGSSIPPYDWSADVDMFYNGQRKMWEITGDFKAGEFKFRPNDVWSGDFPGTNIVLAEDGNYTIRMETVTKTYKIIKN